MRFLRAIMVSAGPPTDVLIVEDDDDVREVLVEALEHLGYRTQCARDGQAALTAMAAGPVGVVVLDLMMPGMDGWQFRAEQRRSVALARVPVVVLTALSAWRSKRELIDVPDADFLMKPVDLVRLRDVVARHVTR